MKTIKLPYKSSAEFYSALKNIQRNQSSIIRYAFNRYQEKLPEKDIRKKIKDLRNELKDSWIVQSGIMEAKQLYSRFKDKKIIFGGKYNLKSYLKQLITKDQYKENKLFPLTIQGEMLQKGNRKFSLDIVNDKIIFKMNKLEHFELSLPRLKSNYKKQLSWLEIQAKQRKMPFSIKLTKEYIFISFEEEQFKVKTKNNRVIGIDLNPNSIGYSICDYNEDKQNIVDSGIVDTKKLNESLNVSSDSTKQIHQNNKREHELHQVVLFLIYKAVHYKCSKFIIEDLNIKNKNQGKGRKFNRMVNNNWNRNLIIGGIKKWCSIFGIQFIEINPAYSSIIGNTIYPDYPDPICASLEINRRGYFKYQKDKFYPSIPSKDVLDELWKQTLEKSFGTWKELSEWLKNSKLRYRIPLSENLKSFSYKSPNSNIRLYEFGCL
jgi:IS605 OrfB family transposase